METRGKLIIVHLFIIEKERIILHFIVVPVLYPRVVLTGVLEKPKLSLHFFPQFSFHFLTYDSIVLKVIFMSVHLS